MSVKMTEPMSKERRKAIEQAATGRVQTDSPLAMLMQEMLRDMLAELQRVEGERDRYARLCNQWHDYHAIPSNEFNEKYPDLAESDDIEQSLIQWTESALADAKQQEQARPPQNDAHPLYQE